MSRVDAHLHVWDLEQGDYAWLGPASGELFASFGPERAEAELVAAGIDGAVLVQAEDTLSDTAYLLDVAEQNDWVLGVVGWVQLDQPDAVPAQLARWMERPKFCGVRHLIHIDPREGFLRLENVQRSLKLLAESGVTFDVPDAWPRYLPDVTVLAATIPELTIVVDHLGKPPREIAELAGWRHELAKIAAHPNTFAKVSGLHLAGEPYAPAILEFVWDAALETFGPNRLMWGSDWPMTVPAGGYAPTSTVLNPLVSGLSPAEQASIFANTAVRAYKLWRSLEI